MKNKIHWKSPIFLQSMQKLYTQLWYEIYATFWEQFTRLSDEYASPSLRCLYLIVDSRQMEVFSFAEETKGRVLEFRGWFLPGKHRCVESKKISSCLGDRSRFIRIRLIGWHCREVYCLVVWALDIIILLGFD